MLQIHNIVSISGEAGTGKTTLALTLIGQLLTKCDPFHSQCMWVQASDFFPTRRLAQLFKKDVNKIRFLRNNILITPLKRPFLSYEEQTQFLLNVKNLYLPPELKVIAIDNISHHLRYELSQYSSINDKTSLLNRFYQQQLLPLIFFCQKKNLILIFIHEVTYNPNLDKELPFFYKLYKRIESINLFLENKLINFEKTLTLKYLDFQCQVKYQIQNDGFRWIKKD